MIELKAGDIVLARGRRFQHWLSRKLLNIEWNHILLMVDNSMVLELTWENGVVVNSINAYNGKQIVILRRKSEHEVDNDLLISAVVGYEDNLNFDWVGFFLQCLQLPSGNRNKKVMCDDFVKGVYAKAGVNVNFRKRCRRQLTAFY